MATATGKQTSANIIAHPSKSKTSDGFGLGLAPEPASSTTEVDESHQDSYDFDSEAVHTPAAKTASKQKSVPAKESKSAYNDDMPDHVKRSMEMAAQQPTISTPNSFALHLQKVKNRPSALQLSIVNSMRSRRSQVQGDGDEIESVVSSTSQPGSPH